MRCRRTWAVLAAALLGVPAAPMPAHAAPALRVWTLSAADRAFPGSLPPAATSPIALHAARGEQEAAQIAVRSSSAEPLTAVQVTASDLTGPGGAVLPTSGILLRRAYEHRAVQIMDGDAERPPGGGTGYYDALVENDVRDLPGGVTRPYHYSLTVPAGQAPGGYTGSVTVHTGNAGTATIPVRLVVHDATLPPPRQSTFKMNNWFTSAGWDYRGTEAAIPAQYGVPLYSPGWWQVLTNIAANHKRHRNNVVHSDFQALLIPSTKIGPAGELLFDWTTFDRFVDTFENAGILQYLYTATLLEPGPDGTAQVEILRTVDRTVKRELATPDNPETNAYFDRLFPALKAHLDARGLTGRFYFSALDEPRTQDQVAAANWLYAKYRRYFPNPLTNEAHLDVLAGLDQNLTTVTPILDRYERDMAYYQTLRANGTELWLYNCIDPKGPYANRFISYHLAKTRLTPWLAWQAGATGYLHWGWNFWFDDPAAPVTPADTFDGPQTGDNWLVRPNKAALDVYDSLRSETQLDGIEDYELLAKLAETKPRTARAIADSLITDLTRYTRSGADVDARHEMILNELGNGLPDQDFPFAEGFSGSDGSFVRGRGAWSVTASGEYVQTDVSGWGFTSAPKARAYGDVAASVDLKIDAVNPVGGDTNWGGLIVHSSNATDLDTGYLVGLRNDRRVFVYRSGRELGSAPVPDHRPGVYTRLRVVVSGHTLSVYAGSTPQPLLTVTDDVFPAGNVALATGGAAVRFDNFALNPGTNPAEGRPVTTSSAYVADGWHPAAAVDGRRASVPGALGWSSATGPSANRTEAITVDLGSVRPLSRIDLFPRADGVNTGAGFPVDFTVQTSADGAGWTTVAARTGQPRPDATAQSFPFPPQSARYVRVTGTKLGSDPLGAYAMQLAEIEVYGGNLAAGRPVSASSSYEAPAEGWQRASLTDGSHLSSLGNSLGWSSAAGVPNRTEWAAVDLGWPSRISRVELHPRTDGPNTGAGFPIDFTIEVSADGVGWTQVAVRTGAGRPDGSAQVFTFPATTARYVRVVGTRLSADPRGEARMQLAELRTG